VATTNLASLRAIVTVARSAPAGSVLEVRALAQHPMETGYRRGADGDVLPRDLLRRLECRFDGELVLLAELHAALSANPYVSFDFKLPRSGALTLTWQGDRGVQHTETISLTAV
jgi:sulfur-oxidizing protein SoxZ